jgi:hypothetical protein
MAKDPRVNHYRSGVKNPGKEVVVFDDGVRGVKVTVVDYVGMRVSQFSTAPVEVTTPAPIPERRVATTSPAPEATTSKGP